MLFFYIFLFIYSVHSLEVKPVKLCANCKHFISKSPLQENGKCSLFPILKVDRNRFGSGYTSYIDYEKCAVVRNNDNMCGKEGKRYEVRNGDHEEEVNFLKKLSKGLQKNGEFLKCPNWVF